MKGSSKPQCANGNKIERQFEQEELVALINLAAEHFGMTKQDIFRALTAGYFLNASGDMMAFFDEIIPEGKTREEFFAALRNSVALTEAAKSINVEL